MYSIMALATQCGDVYAVSEYLRHSDIRTTTRYMKGASSQRMKVGIEALRASLPTPVKKTAVVVKFPGSSR